MKYDYELSSHHSPHYRHWPKTGGDHIAFSEFSKLNFLAGYHDNISYSQGRDSVLIVLRKTTNYKYFDLNDLEVASRIL